MKISKNMGQVLGAMDADYECNREVFTANVGEGLTDTQATSRLDQFREFGVISL